MSKQLKLKIVTPEKLVLEELVESVTLPTMEGEITILPEHVPIIAGLKSGDVVAFVNGEHVPMAVVGGFVEVKKEEGVTTVAVLADFAEHIADITDEAIEKAKARAEELQKIANNKEIVDFEHFATELERSLTRVKIADKWKTRKYRR
jgi:F-type H+-transporting ATPase subunit epsilon